jgi:hypothetical protein
MPEVQFDAADFEVFARNPDRVSWTQVAAADAERYRGIRTRLRELADTAARTYPGEARMVPFVSILNPNGRNPLDYWCCIYPDAVPNKSFGLQVALIVSATGAEVCFCLGAGTSQERDPDTIAQNADAFRRMRSRLADIPGDVLAAIERRLNDQWHFRKSWRQATDSRDFATLAEWIDHAASPQGRQASVSLNISPTDLVQHGGLGGRAFREAVETFAPLIDYVYAPSQLPDGAIERESVEEEPVSQDAVGPRHWFIAAGEGGRLWQHFLEDNCIAIGWDHLGDLGLYAERSEILKALREHGNTTDNPFNNALACYQFAHEMAEGDYVYAKRGRAEILGYGVVRSGYLYDPSYPEYHHRRQVEWTAIGPWRLPEGKWVAQKTLTDLTQATAFLEYVHSLMLSTAREEEDDRTAAYTVEQAMDGLFLEREQFEEMLNVLNRKRNLVITGPPGVGKTFIARRLAYAAMGQAASDRVEMVQFHQSYSYEDFIRGWRPNSTGGFDLQDGVFFEFCAKARQRPSATFVFIIDEINRGNLSKIFGELLMLIEADKRGPLFAVGLTYKRRTNEERFYVPPNVMVLGLMNTADRSLAMVDYALRRRFGFANLSPAYESAAFREHLLSKGVPEPTVDTVVVKMSQVNNDIIEDKNLGHGFAIGHSYFVPTGDEEEVTDSWYRRVIKTEIEPLLMEYWFENPGRVKQIVERLLV